MTVRAPMRVGTVPAEESFFAGGARQLTAVSPFEIKWLAGQYFTYDNSWCVSYTPSLIVKYNYHINTDYVGSAEVVRYCFKIFSYVLKGNGRQTVDFTRETPPPPPAMVNVPAGQAGGSYTVANVTITVPVNSRAPHSEIIDDPKRYMDSRYCSANEAHCRLSKFPLVEPVPTVTRLKCHLPNGQRVIWNTDCGPAPFGDKPPESKLTCFFALNLADRRARTLLYTQIPYFYTYKGKVGSRQWAHVLKQPRCMCSILLTQPLSPSLECTQ